MRRHMDGVPLMGIRAVFLEEVILKLGHYEYHLAG